MSNWSRLRQAQQVVPDKALFRRYLVVNGFDGALTMLGILSGFALIEDPPIGTLLGACLGAAVALLMSGLSSAYLSESAEQKKKLAEIEKAMVRNLHDSHHGVVAKWTPWLLASVNGLSPFLISLLIVQPLLWKWKVPGLGPVELALALGFICIFFLGVFLARVSKGFWLKSGLKALLVGAAIMLLTQIIQ